MIRSLFVVALMCMPTAAIAETWTCRYQAFGGTDTKDEVTTPFTVNGTKLLSSFGAEYDILENDKYAIIAAGHYTPSFNGIGIMSRTVMIDKTLGKFAYIVTEINDSPPLYRLGRCRKDNE